MFKDKLKIFFNKEFSGLSYEKNNGSVSMRFKLNTFNGMVYVGCTCDSYKDGAIIASNDANFSEVEDGCDFIALITRCFASARVGASSKQIIELVNESEIYVSEKLEGEL